MATMPPGRRIAAAPVRIWVNPVGEFVVVAVGEVARVGPVLVVDLADLAPAGAGGADVAVGGRPVRRGGGPEGGSPGWIGGGRGGEGAGVPALALPGAGGALGGGEVGGGGGPPPPPGL